MKCNQEKRSINLIWIDQHLIELNPVYQREAGVWSIEKKHLFIDSLLNGFDVPKIYFNELGNNSPRRWAVIDGKQRISTIIGFMDNAFPLAEDFIYTGDQLAGNDIPISGQYFRDFTERAREILRSTELAVTITQDSTEEEIESLFARLNNGEPLNSAEQRNAIGGHMAELVRDVADKPFFTNKCSFSLTRFAHREVAAKFLLIEKHRRDGGNPDVIPALKKKMLDDLVKKNKQMTNNDRQQLIKAVDEKLRRLTKLFDDGSPELRKQTYPHFFYIWTDHIARHYGHANLNSLVKSFIPEFTLLRTNNNELNEDQRDPSLIEFDRLAQQGTNDPGHLQKRSEIMTRYFLFKNPDIHRLDERRAFSADERYVIWLRSNKRCNECGTELLALEDMDADHVDQWVHGGSTTFSNARALCIECNRRPR